MVMPKFVIQLVIRAAVAFMGTVSALPVLAEVSQCDQMLPLQPVAEPIASPMQTRSFSLRETHDAFIIDTGAGLVFTVRRRAANVAGKGVGDIVSLVYRGVEYQDPQKGSQVNSGYSDLYDNQAMVSVEAAQIDNDHIKVAVRAGELTQYYLAQRGKAMIVMATTFSHEPKLGLVRFITRLRHNMLPVGPPCSDLNGTDHIVEAHDVFGLPDGETRSKHYSNMRLKDWSYFGARGQHAAVWMVRDGQEGGSGGPFYRSLLDQGTKQDQELTYIVNYGEVQTEQFRTNIPAVYALTFTDGGAPPPLDTSWLAEMGLSNWVGPEGRGRVDGDGLMDMDPGYPYTIGFANATAQYWADTHSGSGRFESPAMLPGEYRMTVYKGELAVATRDVAVVKDHVVRLKMTSIVNDPSRTHALWRIGQWDGMPSGLLNADKVTIMHPSDRRMAPWRVAPFTIGRSADANFPAYQWADVNNPVRIFFRLSPQQVAAMTLRVGITIAYAGGRPAVRVNDWIAPLQQPSIQPNSRSLTVGSYRGNNTMFSFSIPLNAFHAGDNEIDLSVISGKKGNGFLSPGISYDAIDLIATPAHF